MRALCGAIITAGALVGLGLTAIGVGIRYGHTVGLENDPVGHLRFRDMDNPLMFILFFLTLLSVVGLALTFLGLAYHHHRRHHEHLRQFGDTGLHHQPATTTTHQTGI